MNFIEIKSLKLEHLTVAIAIFILAFASPQFINSSTEQAKNNPANSENNGQVNYKDIPNTEKGFVKAVEVSASNLGIKAEDLMTVMLFETMGTLDPAIQRKDNKATGLIQFMPNTAKELNTTVSSLKKMNRVQQMQYVEKYLRKRGLKQGMNTKQLYSTIFCGNPHCSGSVGDGFHTLNGAVAKMNTQHRPIAQQILKTNGDLSI